MSGILYHRERQRTVNRPREIVPTNLVMLIGHGIFLMILKIEALEGYQGGGQLSFAASAMAKGGYSVGAWANRWRGQRNYMCAEAYGRFLGR